MAKTKIGNRMRDEYPKTERMIRKKTKLRDTIQEQNKTTQQYSKNLPKKKIKI